MRLILLVFILVWSLGTLVFDAVIWYALEGQVRSLGFVPTSGTVTWCEVKKVVHGDEENHSIDIEYAYVVAEVDYVGRRVCYGTPKNHVAVKTFVAEHPPGRQVTVYHDAAEPSDAVLVPGLTGEVAFLVLFSLPFNGMMASLWAGVASKVFLSRAMNCRFISGVRVIDEEEGLRVRLPSLSPSAAAVVAFFVGSILVVLVVAFTSVAFTTLGNPPLPVALGAILLVLAIGPIAFVVVARKLARGESDLVIDWLQKTVTLPRTFGRQQVVVFPLANFDAFDVVEETIHSGEDARQVHCLKMRWHDVSGDLD